MSFFVIYSMNVVARASQELKSRWMFTLHNYDINRDYIALLRLGIKRSVIGYEVSGNNSRHLQGYVELERTQRRSFLTRILPGAHWEPATSECIYHI